MQNMVGWLLIDRSGTYFSAAGTWFCWWERSVFTRVCCTTTSTASRWTSSGPAGTRLHHATTGTYALASHFSTLWYQKRFCRTIYHVFQSFYRRVTSHLSYDLDGIEICTGWAKNWTILEVNISCIWWRKKEFHVYKTVQLFIGNRPTVLLWMLSYFCISLGRPYYTKTTN